LLIDDIAGGFTFTGRGQPQAFQVLPLVVYKVYADGRPDELVRGVDIVGTPLAALTKIVATGDKQEVFNGYCGAESGSVPVSAASPAILTSELEVQKKESSTDPPADFGRRPRTIFSKREAHNEPHTGVQGICSCGYSAERHRVRADRKRRTSATGLRARHFVAHRAQGLIMPVALVAALAVCADAMPLSTIATTANALNTGVRLIVGLPL